MFNCLLIDSVIYPNKKYLSVCSVRPCAGGGRTVANKTAQLLFFCSWLFCVGRQQDSRENHTITTVRRAAKNKYRGYESKERGLPLEVSGVREEWPPWESGIETETWGISRRWPGGAGGAVACTGDEKCLSCLRNKGKARLAAVGSEWQGEE